MSDHDLSDEQRDHLAERRRQADQAFDLHEHGIYVVVDDQGVPVPDTLATTGYSARAQFVRARNMFWSKAQLEGYRLVKLEPVRHG